MPIKSCIWDVSDKDCFDVNDNPVRVEHANGSVSTTCDYLK